MTPGELLESSPTHSINGTARILSLIRRNGEPNRQAVYDLIRTGRLHLIDQHQPIQRWTISQQELRRYINGTDRKTA